MVWEIHFCPNVALSKLWPLKGCRVWERGGAMSCNSKRRHSHDMRVAAGKIAGT